MEQKIVDVDAFQKDVGLDYDTIKELYSVFVEEIEQAKQAANTHLSSGRFEELGKVVHDIKGIASSYKAQNVFECAKSLDIKLKCQEFETINTYVSDLSEDIDKAIREISRYFERRKLNDI